MWCWFDRNETKEEGKIVAGFGPAVMDTDHPITDDEGMDG